MMAAAIKAWDEGSNAPHEASSFQHTGLMPQGGMKLGRWSGLAFLQLILDHRPNPTA